MVVQRNLADMPGLDLTIREVVRAYRQQELAPASAVLPDMQVTLPVPNWAEASFINNITLTYTAGQTISATLLQVPANERAWLEGVQLERASGDNTVSRIRVVMPVNYGSGARAVELILLATGTTLIFWPDPGGSQTITRGLPNGPLLLEPLSLIEVTSDGAGVSGTTFDAQVYRRRMKLSRAQAP